MLLNQVVFVRNNNVDMQQEFNSIQGNDTGLVEIIFTFINNDTGTNQEHIDFEFAIYDEAEIIALTQGLRPTYGPEIANLNLNVKSAD